MLIMYVSVATAAGLDAPQVGSVDSGVLSADPASLFYNPAMLARIDRPSLMAGLGLVVGRATVERNRRGAYAFEDGLVLTSPTPSGLDPSKPGPTERVAATPVAPLGDVLAAIPAGPAVLGFGLTVPYAAVLRWPRQGDQRFALQDTAVIVSNVSGGAALAFGPLSVGATVSYELGFGELGRVQDLAGLEYFAGVFGDPPLGQVNDFGRAAPSTVREQEVLARDFQVRRGVSHGVSFTGGAALQLERWLVSASVASGSAVTFRGRFTLDTDTPFLTNDVAPFGLQYPTQVEGDGSFSVATPLRVRLGVAHQLGAVEVGVSGSWSDWRGYDATRLTLESPAFEQPDLGLDDTVPVEVPRRWQPSVGAEVSVRHPRFTAALGYQSPAAPDATVDAGSVDGHRILGRGGVRIGVSDTVGVWAGGNVQGILPREVTSSDHDLANGRYSLVLATLSAHLTYTAR